MPSVIIVMLNMFIYYTPTQFFYPVNLQYCKHYFQAEWKIVGILMALLEVSGSTVFSNRIHSGSAGQGCPTSKTFQQKPGNKLNVIL